MIKFSQYFTVFKTKKKQLVHELGMKIKKNITFGMKLSEYIKKFFHKFMMKNIQ